MVTLLASKPADWEGRLTYRAPKSSSTFSKQTGYKERYFKLVGNLLFCLRLAPQGKGEVTEPVLVLLMENFTVSADPAQEMHSFTLTFRAEESQDERRHCFVSDSARSVGQWVEALRESSYQHRREQLILLQIKLRNRTGLDPLLGTNLDSNPVYSLGGGPCPALRPGPDLPEEPPLPVPRTKAKAKAAGFTSHLGVETCPGLREVEGRPAEAGGRVLGAQKPSFTSHVPTGNLLDL